MHPFPLKQFDLFFFIFVADIDTSGIHALEELYKSLLE